MSNTPSGSLRIVDPAEIDESAPSAVEQRAGVEPTPESNPSTGDFNLRILLQAPARYIRDKHGVTELERIASLAGLALSDLDGRTRWAAHEQVETFLKELWKLVPGEDEFKGACAYQLKESYGPLRFVLRAMSPQRVYERTMTAKDFKMVSRVSTNEVVSSGANSFSGRYVTQVPESRLMCLSRQAQIAVLPTVWGLPPARLTETTCVAHGDNCCEYHLRWYRHRRWLPTILGALTGVLATVGLIATGWTSVPLWLALPLLGAAAGYIFELRRTNRANLDIGEEMNDALRVLARQDAEARSEILALNKRQRDWSHVLEEQVADRTLALEEVVARIQSLQEERQDTLRGVSHDLSNPLNSLMLAVEYLDRYSGDPDGDLEEIIGEQREAVGKMRLLLRELMELASSDTRPLRLTPATVDVAHLEAQLRRRLKALVHGRDIRVSVLATREAPPTIKMDRLLLDRVLDNLLTNAAKYTERGSIVVELDGRADRLTIKVSDTGRGIDELNIQRIFQPGGSDANGRRWGGYGVGLSVVVRLLDQIGGKLEVMSLPDSGTTFWAHFPVELADTVGGEAVRRPTNDELIEKVVTIRPPRIP